MSTTLTVTPATAPPVAPSLISPANDSRLPPNQGITFSWSAAARAATYEIQIDDSSAFSAPLVVSVAGITQTMSVHSFSAERRYWWRVRGRNSGGTNGAWSSVRNFEIKRGAPPPPPPPGRSRALDPDAQPVNCDRRQLITGHSHTDKRGSFRRRGRLALEQQHGSRHHPCKRHRPGRSDERSFHGNDEVGHDRDLGYAHCFL